MIKTPINKKTLKHHWHYMKVPYLLSVIALLLVCSMVGDSVNAQIDTKNTLECYFCGSYITEEGQEAFSEYMRQAVPDIQDVRVLNISSDLLETEDYAMQQILVYLASGQGDLYIMPENMHRVIQNNGLIMPLDDVLADGTLTADEVIDLSAGYQKVVEKAWDGTVVSEEGPYLMSIPASELWGLWTEYGYDNRDKYILVCFASENLEQCVTLINDMVRRFKTDPPEWLSVYEQYEAIQDEETLSELEKAMEGTPLEIVKDSTGNSMLGYYDPY